MNHPPSSFSRGAAIAPLSTDSDVRQREHAAEATIKNLQEFCIESLQSNREQELPVDDSAAFR
jgi:hypothetical protein